MHIIGNYQIAGDYITKGQLEAFQVQLFKYFNAFKSTSTPRALQCMLTTECCIHPSVANI